MTEQYIPSKNAPNVHGLSGSNDRKTQAMTRAAQDVLAERQRQVEAEGWTPEHDDTHSEGEIAAAAACYAFTAVRSPHDIQSRIWPWSIDWWKPTTPRRDLVKAGALILAEIERLDREVKTAPDPVQERLNRGQT